MKAIEITNLTKFYGKEKGISNVSFSVEKGEIFGFIGPNGAGKSTTIRTLLGLLIPTSGKALILNHDIQKEGANIRKKIGYLPSEVNYYDEMSSRELLEYHSRFYDQVNLNEIDRLAELFELDLNKKITDLSFGNKKKCAIIQSLIHQPEVLILDEPTSGLDPLMQNRFFELLELENKKGTTVFFSSHILTEIQRMCDRAAIIKNGEIVAIEHIHSLLEKQMKKVTLLFERIPENISFIEGINNPKWMNQKLTFDFIGPISILLNWMNGFNLKDATLEEPDLESIFMNYYQR